MDKRKRLLAYVYAVARAMRLGGWYFAILEDEPSDGSVAEIRVGEEDKNADILFSSRFWDASSDSKRQIVTHELLHCHTLHTMCAHWEAMRANMSPNTFVTVKAVLVSLYERDVDEIAEVLAPHMPRYPAKN